MLKMERAVEMKIHILIMYVLYKCLHISSLRQVLGDVVPTRESY